MFEGIKFIMWIINWFGFTLGVVLGLGVGLIGALGLAPPAWRVYRRRSLRRQWRNDVSREVEINLVPDWVEYDPDDETVDRRCVCHGRRIHPGETVMVWPEIGPFGVLYTSVYCENVKESV